MDSPEDNAELLRRCQRGDEDALTELVDRFEDRVYRLALHVAGDPALAQEATVDSFYKIWRKSSQWRGESSADAWICRIAVRTVLDLQRSRRRWRKRARLAQPSGNDVPGPHELAVASEQHQQLSSALERALGTLKEEDRMLVHFYYFEERGLREIAPILDASRDALKMRLARIRAKLKQILENFDEP